MTLRSPRALAAVLLVAGAAGCGADSNTDTPAAEPSRTVEIVATEYAFDGDPGGLAAGETIEFALVNAGQLDHSLEILSEEGRSLGTTNRIPPGETGSVIATFGDAGIYRLICDVDDHLSLGQVASVIVE